MTDRSYRTRKGGKDIDEHCDAGPTDDGQHHIIVEGVSHFIIKQLGPTIQHLHLAGTGEAERSKHLILTVVAVLNDRYCNPFLLTW